MRGTIDLGPGYGLHASAFSFVSPARIELALQAPQACVLSIKLRGQYGQLTLKVPKNPLLVR